MALQLVKTPLVQIEADVLIHFMTQSELQSGSYAQTEIFQAAGPDLLSYLDSWKALAGMHATRTPAFRLRNARFIVHAVAIAEQYPDGGPILIERAVIKALELAYSHGCQRAAMALPAAAWGPAESYRRVLAIVQQYLLEQPLDNDFDIILSVPQNTWALPDNILHREIERYVDANFIPEEESGILQTSERACIDLSTVLDHIDANSQLKAELEAIAEEPLPYFRGQARKELNPAQSHGGPVHRHASLPFRQRQEHSSIEDYALQDKSFIEMVDWWILVKHLKMKDFYIRSNIHRALLSNLRCHPTQIPKKQTALACAIGLELDYDQTSDLLDRAGFSLSRYVKSDVIVEYFIRNGIYDIYKINEELFAQDLSLLGSN